MARLVFPCCWFECAGRLQRLGWVWCLEKFNPPAPNHMLKPTMCLVGCTHLLRCCLFNCWWNTCFSQFISRFWEMVGCLDGGLPCFAAGGVTCLPCSIQKWRSNQTSKLISYVVEGSQRTFSQDLDLSCAQILLLVIRGCPIYMVISHSKCFKIMVRKSPKRSFRYDPL